MNYVLAANIVIWIGIIGYVVFLTKEHKNIIKKVNQLEIEIKQDEFHEK